MSLLEEVPPAGHELAVGNTVEVSWGSSEDFVRYIGTIIVTPGTVQDEAALGAAVSVSESYIVVPTFGERVTDTRTRAIEPLAHLVFGHIGNVIGPSADSHKASTLQISTNRTEVIVRILEG